MTAHAPGPWTVTKLDDRYGQHRYEINGPGHHIATIYVTTKEEDAAVFADARLIAAAPSLLSALEDALESLLRLPNKDGAYRVTCIAQCRAAIALAKGQDNGR